jgi:hypothetical protein
MVDVDAAAASATAPASCSAVARVKRIPSLLSMSSSVSLQKYSTSVNQKNVLAEINFG